MDILYLLIPIALVFVVVAIRLFIWAVRSGQYDDLEMESRRILFDDERQSETGDNREDTDDRRTHGNAENSRPAITNPENRKQ